ncbi:TPA: hypothetical protein PMK43_001984 [Vibrio cholerae]|nr:hypothetical protein [Vibrio cholerae]
MKATAKNFFGTNLEQEVLDEVVILPVSVRNNSTGTITLPAGYSWVDFESIEFYLGISTNPNVYASDTLTTTMLAAYPTTWKLSMSFAAQNVQNYRIDIFASSSTQATWSGSSSASGQTVWPHHVVGRKRRYSRVGIDELMSAMSLPNLIANADLTDNPINQRGFNGNWSSLAVGAYGYDQWMKVSATHMGAVIEAGKYRPSTKHTFTKDDVVLGEFMSPASGHWIVAVPFATSGKFDLYAGQFKRPWHPVQDGMQRCLWFFEKGKLLITGGGSIAYLTASTQIAPKKAGAVVRVYDNAGNLGKCSFDSTNNIPASATIVNNTSVSCTVSNSVANTNVFANFNWQVESSITLAEVGGQITTV